MLATFPVANSRGDWGRCADASAVACIYCAASSFTELYRSLLLLNCPVPNKPGADPGPHPRLLLQATGGNTDMPRSSGRAAKSDRPVAKKEVFGDDEDQSDEESGRGGIPFVKRCANPDCQKADGDLSRCSACRSVVYCSRECQKKHWKKHKTRCAEAQKSLKQLNDVAGAPCFGCKQKNCVVKQCPQCLELFCSKCGREHGSCTADINHGMCIYLIKIEVAEVSGSLKMLVPQELVGNVQVGFTSMNAPEAVVNNGIAWPATAYYLALLATKMPGGVRVFMDHKVELSVVDANNREHGFRVQNVGLVQRSPIDGTRRTMQGVLHFFSNDDLAPDDNSTIVVKQPGFHMVQVKRTKLIRCYSTNIMTVHDSNAGKDNVKAGKDDAKAGKDDSEDNKRDANASKS